jgi:competence protein ComEC
MQKRLTLKHGALLVLLFLNAYVWYEYFHVERPQLQVSFLDVGQGDSILIEGPTGVQLLIDGGPDRSVLRKLPREMGYFDRSLDMLLATHPDKDHIAGLTDVFKQYRVSYFLSSGTSGTTATAGALSDAVRSEKDMTTFTARSGMRIHLGGEAYADVLYPDRDVSGEETNEGSVIVRVVYGATSFMLTGDASSEIESYLLSTYSDEFLESTVLKAGHHGSRHSTSDGWLAAVEPKVVVISAGDDNSYGHPHREVLERVRAQGAQVVSTIESGTVEFVSDGVTVSSE